MPFKVHTETDHHFIAKGNSGDIRIAKKGLTPQRHAAFQAMCRGGKVGMDEGGEVKAGGNGGQGISKDTRPDERAPGWNVADKIHSMLPGWLSARPAIEQHKVRLAEMDRQTAGMADGGQVQRLYEGDAVQPNDVSQADALYQAMMTGDTGAYAPTAPAPDVTAGRLGGAGGDLSSFRSAPAGMDLSLPRGGGPPPVGWAPPSPAAADPANSGVLSSVPGPAASAPLPPPQVPTPVGGPAAGPLSPGPLQMGGMTAQQMQMYNPYGGIMGRLQGAERLHEQGIREQAAAQSQAAREQADAIQRNQQLRQEHEALFQGHVRALADEHDRIVDDVKNSHIDPHRVWSNKGNGQKASAVIGMILGGIGSGLTHQPNAALAVLEKQIDRDIEAQKMDLGKKESLLADNFRQTGNLFQAEQLTRLQMSATLEGDMRLAAARSGSPLAQAQADQAIAAARQSLVGPMMQIAQNQAMFSMMQGSQGAPRDPGYVPSSNRPMPTEFSLKGISEQRKAESEQRIDWIDANGNRRWTHGKPGSAKDANEGLSELSQVRADIYDLQRIAHQASTGILPWSAVRAKWDAIQGHFSMLSPNALSAVKKMSETELGIGKTESGDSIWKTKLSNGAALSTTLNLIQRRQDALLRGQGVDERFLGAGGVGGPGVFTAPTR